MWAAATNIETKLNKSKQKQLSLFKRFSLEATGKTRTQNSSKQRHNLQKQEHVFGNYTIQISDRLSDISTAVFLAFLHFCGLMRTVPLIKTLIFPSNTLLVVFRLIIYYEIHYVLWSNRIKIFLLHNLRINQYSHHVLPFTKLEPNIWPQRRFHRKEILSELTRAAFSLTAFILGKPLHHSKLHDLLNCVSACILTAYLAENITIRKTFLSVQQCEYRIVR